MYLLSYLSQIIKHSLHVKIRGVHDLYCEKIIKEVLTKRKEKHPDIEAYLSTIRKDRRIMQYDSPGAGSRKPGKGRISVSEYAKLTAVDPKKGNLLSELVGFVNPSLIIELGTSLGLSTVYMSKTGAIPIITVEGNKQLAEISSANFQNLRFNQIRVINGLFDDILPELIQQINSDTMVFIDGNHTYEATIKYVNAFSGAAVIVVDDIRWSDSMLSAWTKICTLYRDNTVIDLFSIGIIFPRRAGTTCYAWL